MTVMILRILLFVLAGYLILQFLKKLLGNRRTEGPKSSPSPHGNMVKDPLCGMYMDPRLAVKHETKNGIFYFCSEECKKKFLQLSSGKDPHTPSSDG